MARPDIFVTVGMQHVHESGAVITTRKKEQPRKKAGRVATHEGAHTIAAQESGGIVNANIIQRGDVGGTTTPVTMTLGAVGAAAAEGDVEGSGWDLHVIARSMGATPDQAIAAGHSATVGKEEEIDEVAALLEERIIIGQADVDEAYQNVANRRRGIHTVEVDIITRDGKRKTFETRSLGNRVVVKGDMMLGEWVSLPEAA